MIRQPAELRAVRLLVGVTLSLALCTLSALGEWKRVVVSGKGKKSDIPLPHPLSYWTADPLARDDGGDLCLGCQTPSGHTMTKDDYKATIQVKLLGTVAGHRILQIFYHITGDNADLLSAAEWKVLLLSSEHDMYREIYHLQSTGDYLPFKPAQIVKLDEAYVLSTYDPDGGNGGGCTDGYWIIDGAGPQTLNFDAVVAAIERKLPPNARFTLNCWAMNLDHQQIKSWVQRSDAQCRACGGLGEVIARFRLDGARAEPVSIDFRSDPQD